jgi:arsenate reductase
MVKALLNSFYGELYDPYSAGTEPTAIIPYVVDVMVVIGIDLSEARKKILKNSKVKSSTML